MFGGVDGDVDGDECSVDDVGESSLQGADRLGFRVTGFAPTAEELTGVGVAVRLGERDAVQGSVELPVPDT